MFVDNFLIYPAKRQTNKGKKALRGDANTALAVVRRTHKQTHKQTGAITIHCAATYLTVSRMAAA